MSESHIRMQVSALSVDPISNLPVVLLDELAPSGLGYMLSVSVGLGEASAIAAELDCIELERPTTHRLMAAICARGGIALDRVEIHDLRGGMLCARMCLCLNDGEVIAQECRPSDALVFALLQGAAIWVSKQVLERAGCSGSSDLWALSSAGISDLEFADLDASNCDGLDGLGGLGEAGDTPDIGDLAAAGDDIHSKWKM
ncbi:MAG: hypothetical protein Tsb0020_33640 [Haliangiales bacterium]